MRNILSFPWKLLRAVALVCVVLLLFVAMSLLWPLTVLLVFTPLGWPVIPPIFAWLHETKLW